MKQNETKWKKTKNTFQETFQNILFWETKKLNKKVGGMFKTKLNISRDISKYFILGNKKTK